MLTVEEVSYWYDDCNNPLYQDVTLKFVAGKSYVIVGSSGTGKTTLLALLAGLDCPKKGRICYQGKTLEKIGLNNYRNQYVSIVFQSYNLLEYMSALDNVLAILQITRSKHAKDKEYALAMLAKIGIDEQLALKNVKLLSGGQQQRVAIARAMCCDALIVVADEPTGNLDEQNTYGVMALFEQLAHQQNKCVIIVTHEKEVAKSCDELIELKKRQFIVDSR